MTALPASVRNKDKTEIKVDSLQSTQKTIPRGWFRTLALGLDDAPAKDYVTSLKAPQSKLMKRCKLVLILSVSPSLSASMERGNAGRSMPGS
jgi:hypothetical protein